LRREHDRMQSVDHVAILAALKSAVHRTLPGRRD
jgi:hypothetical protein